MKKDVFHAIADPTRRAMLMLLATHAMTPNALAEHFDSSRQAVSKHLQVLCAAELVKSKKEGREIVYRFNQKKMESAAKWLQQLKQIWEDRFSQLDEILNA